MFRTTNKLVISVKSKAQSDLARPLRIVVDHHLLFFARMPRDLPREDFTKYTEIGFDPRLHHVVGVFLLYI
jgi:hypothetical protein